MTSGGWHALASWHNAWLVADAPERQRLREQLSRDAPDLVEAADLLIADTTALDGFLETPALVLEANALAARYAAGPVNARIDWGGVRRRVAWVAGAVALVLMAGATGWYLRTPPLPAHPEGPLVRFAMALPSGLDLLSAPVLSPDGQRVAFVVGTAASSRLMVRDLGDQGALVVGGTDGATAPFWSPDGRWIGFSARGRLMKVASTGGSPVVIDGAVGYWGGAWSVSGVVVFQPAVRNAGLLRVPDAGGRPMPASILDDSAGDISHRDPVGLPDGRAFLYCLDSTSDARRGLYLARLDAPAAIASTRIAGCPASYVAAPGATGFLLSSVGSHIEARTFDPTRMRLGDPHTLDIAPAPTPDRAPALFTATADVLAYAVAPAEPEAARQIGIVIGWRRLLHRSSIQASSRWPGVLKAHHTARVHDQLVR